MADTDPRRRHSAPVVDGINKSASRAMLRAVGFQDEDFKKPQVGIASTWSQVTPCNAHIDKLADAARTGADAA
ncbi:MAG TPA: dihydroxy-acid dehydratase, partial [Halothiobacillaceae bacterium]|nr:dihydroxy-acid dehydratase [Halothiobacillaceae bacterium]